MSQSEYLRALHDAWADFGDPRSIVGIDDTSPNVSTNTVFRLHLSDRSCVFAKVSNYGSYFLFAEDHDRLFRCTQLLKGTRFEDFLVPVLAKNNQPIVHRPYTWYDGNLWVAFYGEASKRDMLPPQPQTASNQMRYIFSIYCPARSPHVIFHFHLNTSEFCIDTLTIS
jgi:hypothetical protein